MVFSPIEVSKLADKQALGQRPQQEASAPILGVSRSRRFWPTPDRIGIDPSGPKAIRSCVPCGAITPILRSFAADLRGLRLALGPPR
jgi:hypothetical protein